MSSACTGPGAVCRECGARATYEREWIERYRLHGLNRHGKRKRLIHEHTPRVTVEYCCDLHAVPLEKGTRHEYQ
jgi:hypothetical protein